MRRKLRGDLQRVPDRRGTGAKIVERGGDYVLPVKDNQKALQQDC
jgi:hypothetical protein